MGKSIEDRKAALATAKNAEKSARSTARKEVRRLDKSSSPGEFDMHYPYHERAQELHNMSIANTNEAKFKLKQYGSGVDYAKLGANKPYGG